MTKVPRGSVKPHQGANLGQSGPSASKRQAAHDRSVVARALALRCAGCPHPLPHCVWVCALACGPADPRTCAGHARVARDGG